MYLGRLVEIGGGRELFASPKHPYTRMLLDAVPDMSHTGRQRIPSRANPQPDRPALGCTFHPRCPFANERCVAEIPAFKDGVACHAVHEGGWCRGCRRWRRGTTVRRRPGARRRGARLRRRPGSVRGPPPWPRRAPHPPPRTAPPTIGGRHGRRRSRPPPRRPGHPRRPAAAGRRRGARPSPRRGRGGGRAEQDANSSPPIRATTSPSRQAVRSRVATRPDRHRRRHARACRFTGLKPSRSTSSRAAKGRRPGGDWSKSAHRAWKRRPVGQAGQGVELGQIAGPVGEELLLGDVLLHPEDAHRGLVLGFHHRVDADPAPATQGRDDLGIEAEAAAFGDGLVAHRGQRGPRERGVAADDPVAIEGASRGRSNIA